MTTTPASALNESLTQIFKTSENVDTELFTILEYIETQMELEFMNAPRVAYDTRSAIKHFIDSGAKFLGCGTTRICFTYGENQVVKIPFKFRGYEASSREVDCSKVFKNNPEDCYTPIADCEFFMVEGIEMWLLVMEKITKFPKRWKKLPEWTQSVDCAQVGYNSRGELVAYDL